MKGHRMPALTRRLEAVDVAFLNGVARDERRRTRAGVTGLLLRGGARAGMTSRRWLRRVATLTLVLVAAGGLVAGGSPAHAESEWNFCGWRKLFSPDRASDGIVGELLQEEYVNRRVAGRTPKTNWAQYGTAGTDWSTFWLDCFDTRLVVNFAANALFGIARDLSALAIAIFMWTFKGLLLDVFLAPDTRVAGGTATLDQIIRQAHVNVYLHLAAVATLIGALVIAWRWLIGRAAASEVLGKFAWMVVVAGLALVYGGVPGPQGKPQAATVLKTFNDWTNEITIVVLAAFSGTDCETNKGVKTGSAAPAGEEESRASRDMALECAAENFYNVTIFVPWAIGMIGSYERPLPNLDGGGPGPPTQDMALAQRILMHKAYSFDDIEANKDRNRNDNPRRYTDARTYRGNDFSADICKNIPVVERPPSSFSGKACDRATMRQEVFGADDDQFPKWGEWKDVDAKKNKKYWEHWSGGRADERFQIAILALIGSSSIAIVLILVSLAYLTLQVGTIMLALMAPVAFLIGLIPGFGVQVFLRWLELLLGTFIKRIVLGLFVGLLVSIYGVVLTIPMPYLMKLLLICTIALFGLIYRRRFADAFTLNFSGSTAFHQDGDLARRAAQLGGTATRVTARKTARIGFGTIGGALGAAYARRNPLYGAVRGAVREASPDSLRSVYDFTSGRPPRP
ncbi:hypothetical protein [Virgisporangium aurantiacum]|uniref:TrbL/VirB6 plasmid conjugal transfer protein n=1 Tax=Virgisporangium aurantiacum TaxID=175570 RepID=A0A8J3ZCX0_9ACTN|nr:hypothetical protein [Virgisporangium aurantiacum]GIJ58913.1 hypothetical protein Vau01_064290 [Virgisporangium aurantiacum]